jgi:putative transposase
LRIEISVIIYKLWRKCSTPTFLRLFVPMSYNPEIHHRRSIRLQGYDYSQSGAYFVTICTFQRQHLFGAVNNGEMQLNVTGQIVSAIWQKIPQHFPNVEIDEFILMPDHLHGIIVISEQAEQSISLATIIQNFKSISTRKINKITQNSGVSIWQRNYHERIVRNDQELHCLREYILTNPENWKITP